VFFDALVGGVIIDYEALDTEIAAFTDRPVPDLDPVERAILRMGAHELRSMAEIPWRAVINEAVELAHVFGAEQSHKYVNGVLDRVARRLRSV
jgi:N utilization substance protein B